MEVNSKNFQKDDVMTLYDLVSNCIGKKLSESKNSILLLKPDWDTHNPSKSVLCKIDNDGYVGLKKYDENVHFAKQEQLISKLKKLVGFPYYNVIKSEKLSLMSGGSTGIFIRLHSEIVSAIFSVSPESAVRMADIYIVGKLAFIYAVW